MRSVWEGVEPVAAACEVLDQVSIRAGEPVAILGDGKLGLLICQVLQGHGARVHLFGHHPRKLQIAEELGIDTVSSTERPSAQFNFVVECTGSSEALGDAIAMVRPKGTVIMKSTVHMPVTIDTAPVIVNEISLIGSRCGRFEPAIELLRDRQISVTPLLSAEFPLHQAPAAFAEAARRGVLKVLLRP